MNKHSSVFRGWTCVAALLVAGAWAVMSPMAAALQVSPRSGQDLPVCTASSLRASLFLQGATGSLVGSIIFISHAGFPCGLSGRPSIRVSDGHGRALPIRYVRAKGDLQGAPVSTTELVPGAQAAVFVQWQNWCRGGIVAPVRFVVTLPYRAGVLKVRPGPGGQGRAGGPRCDVPGSASVLSVAPFEPGYSVPAQTIRDYYQAIDGHQYRAAYRYVASVGRAAFPAFARGYRDTVLVSLDRLAVPRYTIGSSAVSYTCVGLEMHARRTTGTSIEFGGWYLVQVRLQSTGYLVLPGSSIAPDRPLTIPDRSACRLAIPRSLSQPTRSRAPAGEAILGAVDFLSAKHGWIELSSSAGYTQRCQASTRPAHSCHRATTGIFETSDAGRTWVLRLRFTGRPLAYIGADFVPGVWMHFFDGWHGLVIVSAGTGAGTLYRTVNGGASWTSHPLPHQIGLFESSDVTFADWRHLWLLVHEGAAMGSETVSVYRTWDAGDHWVRVACTPVPAPGGLGSQARSGIEFGGHKDDIVFANLADGFLADNNASGIPFLYVTHDGGYRWSIQRPGLPRGVPGPNPKTGEAPYAEYRQPIFLGRLGILPTTVTECRQVKAAHGGTQSRCTHDLYALLSHDGGRSWSATRRIPSPATNQVSPVWQVMNGATWWSVTGDTVWQTVDAGTRWTAVRSKVPAGFALLAVQFVDGRSGWAIAARENRQQGVIYATRLLRTVDAGAAWSSASVPRIR